MTTDQKTKISANDVGAKPQPFESKEILAGRVNLARVSQSRYNNTTLTEERNV